MKNILIDTNIALDFLLNRVGYKTSSEILSLIKDKVFIGWFSAHSIDTLYYILRKKYKKEQTKELLKKFFDGFVIIPTRKSSIDFESKLSDFEDSIVEQGAHQFNLNAIISRNKKDFENSRIPAFTPEEFLESVFCRSQSDAFGTSQTQSNNIQFLDLKAQLKDVYNEIDDEITNIISNTAFVMGKAVASFESSFAEAHNAKYCYGVGTGTAGNHMVLWALGIGPGDEVIIPANTFIATAWGATLCGAKPVFVDCHPESYNIDPSKVEAAITEKTKAIVAVHLYGQPADMTAISEQLTAISFELREKGVFVNKESGQKINLVEDCAQAHLSEYLPRVISDADNLNTQHNIEESSRPGSKQNSITRGKGRRVGGLGIASSFSFYPGKNLGAYGEGGAVMTDNEELAKMFKMIRDHGAEQKYYHQIYGHNYRMEGIQGAVLGAKLKHLVDWTNGRRRVAAKYKELLKDVEEIKLPKEMDYARHVYHLFVIQVTKQLNDSTIQHSPSETRDALQKFLDDNGISTGLHYPVPLHLQPCFEHLGYKKGDFPVSEELAEIGLSLPMYQELSDEQIEYVCSKIVQFFNK